MTVNVHQGLDAGNKELVVENYEKALKLSPNSTSAMDALRQLRENK
jgi:hypothetical protein